MKVIYYSFKIDLTFNHLNGHFEKIIFAHLLPMCYLSPEDEELWKQDP
jgi:hypothetical protein